MLSPALALSIYYLLANMVFAAILLMVAAWRGEAGDRRLLRYFFPKEVWLHPSSLFDYQYYIFAKTIKPVVHVAVFFCAGFVAEGADLGLTALMGPAPAAAQVSWKVTALETVVLFIVFDFSYWFAHWLMHRVKWLWEFHKGHHSALVMTPFTVLRMHPLEEFESGLFIVSAVSACHLVFTHIFGTGAQAFQMWEINVITLVFYATIFNLRHSHVWIPVMGFWGYIIHSPAHHQLHHSNARIHADKNMGFCLSVWDWMFGTLVIPGKEPVTKLGIGSESEEYNRFIPFLTLPFRNAWRVLRGNQ